MTCADYGADHIFLRRETTWAYFKGLEVTVPPNVEPFISSLLKTTIYLPTLIQQS